LHLPANALADSKEFMASLAKGLAVLRAFNASHPAMNLTEAAAVAGLSRAAARRVLLTLADLGYVVHTGSSFSIGARKFSGCHVPPGAVGMTKQIEGLASPTARSRISFGERLRP
jgi:hypothetical protein